MNVKIKDVARLAGVSISTVSNVLNESKYVSPAKQQAVLNAVKELGYVPNMNARLLKARHTGNIGLFLPYIDGPFYPRLMHEVYHACSTHGYAVFTHVAQESNSQKTAATILSCNIDAAIILNDHLLDQEITTLVSRNLPMVFMDRQIFQNGISCILLDNDQAVAQQVSYLKNTGHKRIAYMRGVHNYDGDIRLQSFCKYMKEHSLPLDESLIMEGQFSEKVAYNCLYYLLRTQRAALPDAILCANDDMAIGCIKALTDLSYQVPKDVSVLGFDNLIADSCTPPLTTVGYSLHTFARKAVDEAVRLIQNPQDASRMMTLETEMIVRQSVAFRKSV